MQQDKNKFLIISLSICIFILFIYAFTDRLFFDHQKKLEIGESLSGLFKDQFAAVGSLTSVDPVSSSIANLSKGILPPDSPVNYTDNKNGTITDNYTRLMWVKCALGTSGTNCEKGSPSLLEWSKARNKCDDLVFAGKSDWRMPTLKELESIVNSASSNPSINSKFFPKTSNDPYWTNTTPAGKESTNFTVIFSDGSVYFQNSGNPAATRCLRDK